jgi:hypothetical protein
MHFYLQWFVIYHDLSNFDFLCSFHVAFMKANGNTFLLIWPSPSIKPAKKYPIGNQHVFVHNCSSCKKIEII